jgi:hypothetical protein
MAVARSALGELLLAECVRRRTTRLDVLLLLHRSLLLLSLLQLLLLLLLKELLLLEVLLCGRLVVHCGRCVVSRTSAFAGPRRNLPDGTGEGWPEELSADECERFDLDHENFEGIAGRPAKRFAGASRELRRSEFERGRGGG